MKRVGHLFERVVDFEALRMAARRAARGKRAKTEVAAFLFREEAELIRLQAELCDGSYTPGPYQTFTVRDPKTREICAPRFRDRVVHHALCAVMEPLFEQVAIFDSYACRVGKGAHAAVLRAQELARGARFFLKLDMEKFFASVDHSALKARIRRLVKDPRVLRLTDRIIDLVPPANAGGKGVPIGSLTSQHFANLYLADLDHHVKEDLRVRRYLRYMDDLLLFADDKATLHGWVAAISKYAGNELHLQLKARATLLAPVSEGVPFLGIRIWPWLRRLTRRRKTRFVRAVRRARERIAGGEAVEAMASLAGSIEAARMADSFRLRSDVMHEVWKEGRSATRARTG